MNKNCWMGHSKELISLSRSESPLCLCFKFVLLPAVAEGFEIIRETASAEVVTGPHQLCSSVVLRTAIRRDLSKSSAEQTDFDALWLLYAFVGSPGTSVKGSVLRFSLCHQNWIVLYHFTAMDCLEVQIQEAVSWFWFALGNCYGFLFLTWSSSLWWG